MDINQGGSGKISSHCIDLVEKINAKREELNALVKNGISEESLETSRELDELIVMYMNEQIKK